MGAALASAAVALGHDVVIVSGPVHVEYPAAARVVPVVSTEQMLEVCCREFESCDGLIAAAAPCDYRPRQIESEKIAKTGEPLLLQLIETPDIVATLAGRKRSAQWFVGFALETNDQHYRALVKLEKKSCDLMVLNGPQAIDAETNHVELMDRDGRICMSFEGDKREVARRILIEIQSRLLSR